MVFFCLKRIALSWLASISLSGLVFFILANDGLVETIIYNTRIPFMAVAFAAIGIGQETAIRGSLRLFVTGAVLFLASLSVFAFVTGAPLFMFKVTGNKPLDYTILYGSAYLGFATIFCVLNWFLLRRQQVKRD